LQRARLISATLEVAAVKGAANMTVAHVVERSGVSRRTFYEIFEDREDCFHAAFEQALGRASERVLAAYGSQRAWRERIGTGLLALLEFLDHEPILGRMLIVEAMSGGPRTLARRNEAMARITMAVDAGRGSADKASLPASPLTAEAIVGGAFSVIHARMAQAGHAPLVSLTGPLMSMIVMPYLGAAAARRELERPAPYPREERGHVESGQLLADPFKEAGMRLTYRTVRALTAIVERPGASNRAIAQAAGVGDQGQISKLLGRLERIGLVANTGLGPGTGTPNAWTLTDKGRQVVYAIHSHSTSAGIEG
jgi:AcrR family transcriptional regulator/DNA-binding MarR family transcriptional regulator